jgi:hypothetical protein
MAPSIPARPVVTPPAVITAGTPTSQIVTAGNLTGLTIPHISVPVIDPNTSLMSEPWFNYFSQKERIGQESTFSDVLPSTRGGSAAGAMDMAMDALLRTGRRSEPGSDALISRVRPRQWSTFELIPDTRANRANYPAAAYPSALYAESDTGSTLVYRSTGATWVYFSGSYESTLANILTGLGTDDTGLLQWVTDYSHMLAWGGAAWGPSWGKGDPMSPEYGLFENAPSGFGANAWQVCDGSTVAILSPDGTTSNATVPNVTTARYLKVSTTAAAVAAASGHTTSDSGGIPAGTVSQPTFTGDAVAAASTAASPDLVAADGTAAGVSPVTTATGTVSQPTFTGSALAGHNHGPNDLELTNKQARLYRRR